MKHRYDNELQSTIEVFMESEMLWL